MWKKLLELPYNWITAQKFKVRLIYYNFTKYIKWVTCNIILVPTDVIRRVRSPAKNSIHRDISCSFVCLGFCTACTVLCYLYTQLAGGMTAAPWKRRPTLNTYYSIVCTYKENRWKLFWFYLASVRQWFVCHWSHSGAWLTSVDIIEANKQDSHCEEPLVRFFIRSSHGEGRVSYTTLVMSYDMHIKLNKLFMLIKEAGLCFKKIDEKSFVIW